MKCDLTFHYKPLEPFKSSLFFCLRALVGADIRNDELHLVGAAAPDVVVFCRVDKSVLCECAVGLDKSSKTVGLYTLIGSVCRAEFHDGMMLVAGAKACNALSAIYIETPQRYAALACNTG